MDSLFSTFDTSHGKRTGPHDEAIKIATMFEASYPHLIKIERFGYSAEGRQLIALIVAKGEEEKSPDFCRVNKRPVVFFQSGIHPGEIEGKDAGWIFLRKLVSEDSFQRILEKLTLVIVPTLNPDGHDRMSPYNRPNQRGPEEMGWRTSGQNLNLNRDYTKVDAPEMRAVLSLLNAWDPILFCDIHATDGAKFEHDVSFLVDAAAVACGKLRTQGKILEKNLLDRLAEAGHLPLPFYPSFREEDRPESGFDLWVLPPRYSNGYTGAMRQRLSVLVETHSWRPYYYRVATVLRIFEILCDLSINHCEFWLDAAVESDLAAESLAGDLVPLTYTVTKQSRMIPFKGYAFKRELSAISGQLRIQYDEGVPQVWTLPLFDQVVPDVSVKAPNIGYVIPKAFTQDLSSRLSAHGIMFSTLEKCYSKSSIMSFRASSFKFAGEPFEGRTRLEVQGDWSDEVRDLPKGSLFIPIHQPKARLILHLFEPKSPDSFLAWGFFNACFEQKEIMENYVCEEEAEKMLLDKTIRDEFYEALKDPVFAGSPSKRLEFFYRRHPSWDERFALYPIYRLESEFLPL